MRAIIIAVLLWSALSLLGFGVAIMVAPLDILAKADVVTSGAAAAVELRAFYGGLEVALGVLILICTWKPTRRRDGLWLTLFVFAGLGLTRGFGMLIDEVQTPFLNFALAVELATAAVAAWALRRKS